MAWRKDPVTNVWKRYRRMFNTKTNTYEYTEMKPRRNYATAESVSVQVRCSGHLHTVSFTPHKNVAGKKPRYGGRLTLHHHDIHEDWPLEKAMARLGQGTLSRCFHVHDAFVRVQKKASSYDNISRHRLPPELQHILIDAVMPRLRKRNNVRRHRYDSRQVDLLEIPFVDRVPHLVCMLATNTLKKSKYFSQDKSDKDEYEVAAVSYTEQYGSVDGRGAGYSWNSGIFLRAFIAPPRWWKLWQLGAVLVEGMFVADVAPKHQQKKYPVKEDEVLVIAGKPESDIVQSHLAVIHLEGTEWKLIRWVGTGTRYEP